MFALASSRIGAPGMLQPHTGSLLVDYYEAFLRNQDIDAFRRNVSARYSEGAIPNCETSAWHRSAKIALNMNRRMTHVETGASIVSGTAQSLGPRAFEIPAVGGFMLSDDERIDELNAIYGHCGGACTFRAWDSESLETMTRFWLANDAKRERMQQAQWEAVQPHHWGNRAMDILNVILN
jgi:spore maturation protein CgeB